MSDSGLRAYRVQGTDEHKAHSCDRKRAYSTFGEAARAVNSLNRRNKYRRKGVTDPTERDRLRPVYAYMCRYCGQCHVGRPRKDGEPRDARR